MNIKFLSVISQNIHYSFIKHFLKIFCKYFVAVSRQIELRTNLYLAFLMDIIMAHQLTLKSKDYIYSSYTWYCPYFSLDWYLCAYMRSALYVVYCTIRLSSPFHHFRSWIFSRKNPSFINKYVILYDIVIS